MQLEYADDIGIRGPNNRAVSAAFFRLKKEEERKKVGLVVNDDKTKYLAPHSKISRILGTTSLYAAINLKKWKTLFISELAEIPLSLISKPEN